MIHFIGEKPSLTAFQKGWTWRDGRLAAKSLFDALHTIGISPIECEFYNLFGDHPDDPEIAPIERITDISMRAGTIVAMGDKVSILLSKHEISHKKIVHPAARGFIRKRERYAQHLRDVLVS